MEAIDQLRLRGYELYQCSYSRAWLQIWQLGSWPNPVLLSTYSKWDQHTAEELLSALQNGEKLLKATAR